MEPIDPDVAASAADARPTPRRRTEPGFRRTVITATMAAGLLILGGGAVVLAASPAPSATPSPAATQPSGGTSGGTFGGTAAPNTNGTTTKLPCDGDRGSGSAPSGGGTPSTTTPTTPTAPTTPTTPTTPTAPSSAPDGSQL